jgi:hypothetical protein
MTDSAVLEFLRAIDRELAKVVTDGRRLDLYLIGRAALIVRYGLSLATKDVDIVGRMGDRDLEELALAAFGKGTPNAQRLGLYLEEVPAGIPPIPGSYKRRAEDLPGTWHVLWPRQPEPHDLAVTKFRRFHAGDQQDLKIMCDSGDLTPDGLEQAVDSAFRWAADEEEDPGHRRARANLRVVLRYLETGIGL